jgi:hypothetical protein
MFVYITIVTVHVASNFKAAYEDGDSILHLQNCTVSQPTISHSDAVFPPVLLPGVSAGIMKYSEVIYTHHLQILIGS